MAREPRRSELIALGRAINRRRQAASMTLDDLAAESGVSRVLIVGIEKGRRNPSISTLLELAGALGISASELVRDAEVDAAT